MEARTTENEGDTTHWKESEGYKTHAGRPKAVTKAPAGRPKAVAAGARPVSELGLGLDPHTLARAPPKAPAGRPKELGLGLDTHTLARTPPKAPAGRPRELGLDPHTIARCLRPGAYFPYYWRLSRLSGIECSPQR